MRGCNAHRGQALGHDPFHLARRVLLQGAVVRDGAELLVGIRHPALGQHRLDQPLRDGIGEAPVRRRGMRVVVGRESEVALAFIARPRENVFARPHEFDHCQREVGIMHRVSRFPLLKKMIQGPWIGLRRQRLTASRRQFHDARPALGCLHHSPDRRRARLGERTRHHPVGRHHKILNQLRGAIFLVGLYRMHVAIGNHRFRLHAINVQRAQAVTLVEQNPRRLILQPELRFQARRSGDLRRRAAPVPRATHPTAL